MSSIGPSLGPDPNSDSRKLSCRSETAVQNKTIRARPHITFWLLSLSLAITYTYVYRRMYVT